MLLYENKKAKLLNILKFGINPFKKFVSTGEIKEDLEFTSSRNELVNTLSETIKTNNNFILPIIGGVGTGKTHLYWILRSGLYRHNTVYISLETGSKRCFYNMYSNYIETLELEPLRNTINHLCNEWGALERKYGFFHVVNIDKVRNNALHKLSRHFKDNEQVALRDVINGITTHQLDPYKRVDAERWLLGELMDVREIARLNLQNDLRKNKNAYVMLKLLIENARKGTVIFIDDFEKLIAMLKPPEDEEEEKIFDPSWLYGSESSPDHVEARKVLKKIMKLLSIKGMKVVITLKSMDALEEIKNIIRDIDENFVQSFLDPLFLLKLSEDDILEFYIKNMEHFLTSINLYDFYDEIPEKYFPLNEIVLKRIYKNTDGNPREIIKMLIKIFNDIIFSEEELENVLFKYERSL